jgi:hypothetical protein
MINQENNVKRLLLFPVSMDDFLDVMDGTNFKWIQNQKHVIGQLQISKHFEKRNS